MIGAVAIGRNEGERLRRCLASLRHAGVAPIVYVDSGSTDGSVEHAREVGAEVVQLDMRSPFAPGRARNAGFARLRAMRPDVEIVQFVDADCDFIDGWFERAAAAFAKHPDAAVVCGRLRERWPEASIYNRLCDMEWDGPTGDVEACGGIAAIRVDAFERAGGFDPALIAGEEPELCVRLRRTGWRVLRLPADMAWHDAAMVRFSQWWRRMVRGGHAYAEGAWMHGRSPQHHWVREVRGIVLWGAALPLATLALAAATGGAGALLALAYPAQAWRIGRRKRRAGAPPAQATLYGTFIVLAKFAEAYGAARFVARKLIRRDMTRNETTDAGGAPAARPTA